MLLLLMLLQFCNRNGTPQQFVSGERPIWAVSPSYYHYLGCQCTSGFTARRELAWHGDVMVGGLPSAAVCRRQYASCSCVYAYVVPHVHLAMMTSGSSSFDCDLRQSWTVSVLLQDAIAVRIRVKAQRALNSFTAASST
jgi:hypothetical protein